MSLIKEIEYFDWESQTLKAEKVFGEGFLRWLYETRSGSILGQLLTRELPCYLYGRYKSSSFSKKQIPDFINRFGIDSDEYLDIESCQSFDDFFVRKFKKGQRTFSQVNDDFPAFCEGRYLIYNERSRVPIKGPDIDPLKLLKDEGEDFVNGQVLVCRLAPVDYHYFHYPDNGELVKTYKVAGALDSVSPFALRKKPSILNTNKREVTIIDTENFGKIAMIEVGAFCVGSIEQKESYDIKKGGIKGCFHFGGSTVVVLTQEKNINFDKQILENSEKGLETFIKLGTTIGQRK